ncbi:hypothetical protein WJ438_02030 [Streptomyces sp. GD-15H]|uniref:hypothetical protein n=1 Tax=Streptomyces sp. GD-15H TaxID=3129112 RepID=UPI00324825C2
MRQKDALRAGIEDTINQALDVTGIWRARYRGLPKARLGCPLLVRGRCVAGPAGRTVAR